MRVVFLLLLSAAPSWALEPIDASGKLFGLPGGIYEGTGTLESQNFLPNTKFQSTRRIADGMIQAHTTASLLGFGVAEASAVLKVKPTSPGRFDMLDMDQHGAKAGEGSCDQSSCTFKATVMNGVLTLEETWIPNEHGFDVVRGSQLFKGNPAKYEGKFLLRDL